MDNNVINLANGNKRLTPKELFDNSTKDGQTKIVIGTMKDDGSVGVWTSDMSPQEQLFIVEAIRALAGEHAIQMFNGYTW